MCKVLAVAGIKPENTEKLWKFLIKASPHVASSTDPHGLGYAAQSDSGIWGERWLKPSDAWKLRTPHSPEDTKRMKEFNGSIECEVKYNAFGVSAPDTTHAVILHGRFATCGVGIENTHPFVTKDGKTALIHNGVISNHRELINKTSTCDSECILNEYDRLDVTHVPESIELVANRLSGYYACGVLTEDNNGNKYLDIFKDTAASLTATYIPQLDAMVFCTKPDIVKAACKALKWKWKTFFTVKAGQLIRLNAVTGSVVGTYKFDPTGKAYSTSTPSRYAGYNGWGYGDDGYDDSYSDRASIVDSEWRRLPDGSFVKYKDGKTEVSTSTPTKSAEESAKAFTDSDNKGSDDGMTESELEQFSKDVEERVKQALDVDSDNPASPFHVKAGS